MDNCKTTSKLFYYNKTQKSKNFKFFAFVFLFYTLHITLYTVVYAVPTNISDLTALTGNSESEIILQWTAPGNDGTVGTVLDYDVRYSTNGVIKQHYFSFATLYPQSWTELAAGGNKESRVLSGLVSGQQHFFAIISSGTDGWSVWKSSIDVSGINTASSNIAKLMKPSSINDLTVTAGYKKVELKWTSPGDDGNLYNIVSGTYAIRCSLTAPITNEAEWTSVPSGYPYRIIIPTLTTAGSTQRYTITGLTNGNSYYFAIKTRDENELGWSELDTTLVEPFGIPFNTPPLTFSSSLPANGYISTTTLKPSFDWADTIDPDGAGSVSYGLQISEFNDFSSFIQAPVNLSYSSYTLTESLTDDRTYYWRAKAIDTDGGITYSPSRVLHINTSNSPPTTFYILSPVNNSTVLKRPALTWETSVDPDPPGTIKYTIYYSSFSNFSSSRIISGLTSPDHTFTSNLTENTTYYWKVAANDEYTYSAVTFSSQTFLFYVKPVLPASPSNVKIIDGMISWNPVLFDEDGSTILDFSAYKIYRSTDIKTIGNFETFAGYTIATSTSAVSGFWTVIRAVDVFGNESANSIAVKPDETKQILLSNDKEVIIELPSAAQSSLSNVIISFSKTGNIYDIKALNFSNMSEINGFVFGAPVKITFETADNCVYWYNGIEYVALGGKKGNSITVETTKLGKFYTGTIAASELKLASSFPTKIFTPNNDGINDEINLTFTGVTEDLTDAEIFDITGKKIADMKQNDFSRFSWDGKNSDGKTVLPGVYIYQVKSGKNVCNGTVVVAR